MLIPSSWHFVDLWLEEEQSIQSGLAMEQTTLCLPYGRGMRMQNRSPRTILEGLLNAHSHSLNDESRRTLMAEVELRVEVEILLSPSNRLKMKRNVVMLPPGEFSKPDAY